MLKEEGEHIWICGHLYAQDDLRFIGWRWGQLLRWRHRWFAQMVGGWSEGRFVEDRGASLPFSFGKKEREKRRGGGVWGGTGEREACVLREGLGRVKEVKRVGG